MLIYLGTDHQGYKLKEKIKVWLEDWEYQYEDLGAFSFEKTDDYPDFVSHVSQEVSFDPTNSRGIVLGLTGQGEAIVANKFKGIRAVVYYGGIEKIIRLSREHNETNILAIGAGFVEEPQLKKVLKLWLETGFSNHKRHIRRLQKIHLIEEGKAPKQIIPAILTKNLQELKRKLGEIEKFTQWVHVDVADGKFVNNTSVSPKDLIPVSTTLNLEVHLMVFHPEEYFLDCQRAKFKRIIFHLEAVDNPEITIKTAQKYEFQVSVALSPETTPEKLKPYAEEIYSVLLLGVNPGFQGQKLLPKTLKKVRQFKTLFPSLKVGVDGGVNLENVQRLGARGADYLVVGSALMTFPNKKERFRVFQEKIWNLQN